ncbi:unnamed protein product, partial [Chrysoparadoxa australica]
RKPTTPSKPRVLREKWERCLYEVDYARSASREKALKASLQESLPPQESTPQETTLPEAREEIETKRYQRESCASFRASAKSGFRGRWEYKVLQWSVCCATIQKCSNEVNIVYSI